MLRPKACLKGFLHVTNGYQREQVNLWITAFQTLLLQLTSQGSPVAAPLRGREVWRWQWDLHDCTITKEEKAFLYLPAVVPALWRKWRAYSLKMFKNVIMTHFWFSL